MKRSRDAFSSRRELRPPSIPWPVLSLLVMNPILGPSWCRHAGHVAAYTLALSGNVSNGFNHAPPKSRILQA